MQPWCHLFSPDPDLGPDPSSRIRSPRTEKFKANRAIIIVSVNKINPLNYVKKIVGREFLPQVLSL